jgi:benzoyl-CoA reductase/2-hydroxyglutaryl-CoA dehydratase subunit BcrC/BadD/HgdB
VTAFDFPAFNEIQSLAEKGPVASAAAKPVIGWFCSYTPREILLAVGLQPYRIVPAPGRAAALADSYIERNYCPYVRTCLGEALDSRYGFLDGVVFVNSCDPMRRFYDAWRYYIGGDFVHLLDLPRLDTPPAVGYFRENLVTLRDALAERFHADISGSSLAAAIELTNNIRSRLKELYRVNRQNGVLSAVQMHRIVTAGNILPPDTYSSLLARLVDEVTVIDKVPREGPRILITGSMMDNPQVLGLIEECGARVVGDDLCTGTRQFWQPIEPDGDPLTTLSRHYLERIPCPRMKGAGERFEHIFGLVDEFNVDGVIFYTLKFCDPHLFDVPPLKNSLGERGIPGLVLEGDFTPGTLGRVRTRVEAFVEMLQQHVGAT